MLIFSVDFISGPIVGTFVHRKVQVSSFAWFSSLELIKYSGRIKSDMRPWLACFLFPGSKKLSLSLEFSVFSAQIWRFRADFHRESLDIVKQTQTMPKYGLIACFSRFIKARHG